MSMFPYQKEIAWDEFYNFHFQEALEGHSKNIRMYGIFFFEPVILNQNDDVELTVDNGIGLLDNIFIQLA